MHWADRYIRIPFIDGGRDHSGCDCWGMVRMVLKDQAQIEVPGYGEISAHDLASIGAGIERDAGDYEQWVEIDRPRQFDVVVMTWFGKRTTGHIGIMLDEHRILHTEDVSGPVIVERDHYSIKRRIKFFRRHRKLLNEFA